MESHPSIPYGVSSTCGHFLTTTAFRKQLHLLCRKSLAMHIICFDEKAGRPDLDRECLGRGGIDVSLKPRRDVLEEDGECRV